MTLAKSRTIVNNRTPLSRRGLSASLVLPLVFLPSCAGRIRRLNNLQSTQTAPIGDPKELSGVRASVSTIEADLGGQCEDGRAKGRISLRTKAVDDRGYFVSGLADPSRGFEWTHDFFDAECDVEFSVAEVLRGSAPLLDVVVVADYSGSMAGDVDQLEEAVASLSAVLRPEDRLAMYAFDDHVENVLPMGKARLNAAAFDNLNVYENFGGQTCMRDAVLTGLSEFPTDDPNREKILVVFSDGGETCDRSVHPANVGTAAVVGGVHVLAVGIGDADMDELGALAQMSGGYAYDARRSRFLDEHFVDLVQTSLDYYAVDIDYCCPSHPSDVQIHIGIADGRRLDTPKRQLPLRPRTGEHDPGPGKICPELPPPPPPHCSCGQDLNDEVRVQFEFDRHDVPASSLEDLERVARAMACDPSSRVVLEGLTDTRGKQYYNDELARKRSEAVAEQLVRLGGARSQIEIEPLGEGALESSPDQYDDNRRVTVHWSPGPCR